MKKTTILQLALIIGIHVTHGYAILNASKNESGLDGGVQIRVVKEPIVIGDRVPAYGFCTGFVPTYEGAAAVPDKVVVTGSHCLRRDSGKAGTFQMIPMKEIEAWRASSHRTSTTWEKEVNPISKGVKETPPGRPLPPDTRTRAYKWVRIDGMDSELPEGDFLTKADGALLADDIAVMRMRDALPGPGLEIAEGKGEEFPNLHKAIRDIPALGYNKNAAAALPTVECGPMGEGETDGQTSPCFLFLGHGMTRDTRSPPDADWYRSVYRVSTTRLAFAGMITRGDMKAPGLPAEQAAFIGMPLSYGNDAVRSFGLPGDSGGPALAWQPIGQKYKVIGIGTTYRNLGTKLTTEGDVKYDASFAKGAQFGNYFTALTPKRRAARLKGFIDLLQGLEIRDIRAPNGGKLSYNVVPRIPGMPVGLVNWSSGMNQGGFISKDVQPYDPADERAVADGNAPVILQAKGSPFYVFSRWEGSAAGPCPCANPYDPVCVVEVMSDCAYSCTARFRPNGTFPMNEVEALPTAPFYLDWLETFSMIFPGM